MMMKKSLRSGFEITMSEKEALELIQELSKACLGAGTHYGSFCLATDFISENMKEGQVIPSIVNVFKVVPDKKK